MIKPKILILPGIHGRKFYCNALCEANVDSLSYIKDLLLALYEIKN